MGDGTRGRDAAINELEWDGEGVGMGLQVMPSKDGGIHEGSRRAGVDKGRDGEGVLRQLVLDRRPKFVTTT